MADNHGLTAAAKTGAVIPIFILDQTDRQLGGASRWWLNKSLKSLKASLPNLVVQSGDPITLLPEIIRQTNAQTVTWNRVYEPHSVSRDKRLKQSLKELGVNVRSFPGSTLAEPWETETQSGGPFKVFTPFFKALKANYSNQTIPAPVDLELVDVPDISKNIDEVLPLPTNPDWALGWDSLWQPGETGAREQFSHFAENGLNGYGENRNRPDLQNVSRLSPHLHFGEISANQVISAITMLGQDDPALSEDIAKLHSEIGWRDFAQHLMFHFPKIIEQNWKPSFDNYPWVENEAHLKAWQTGQTGYPLVDAGMRELWQTGYMHNRVRMVAASFLVKHLRIHWREGERWFWDTLLDADLANNCASWQWVTGSGADAAPYFRIFNPVTQGQKFDPNGDYVRKWCPELSRLSNKYLHCPYEAPADELSKSQVKLGQTYPFPIVDHKTARNAALVGYESIKQVAAG